MKRKKVSIAMQALLLFAIGGLTACDQVMNFLVPPKDEMGYVEKQQEEKKTKRQEKYDAKSYDAKLAGADYTDNRSRRTAHKTVMKHMPKLLAAEEERLRDESLGKIRRDKFEKTIDDWIERVER